MAAIACLSRVSRSLGRILCASSQADGSCEGEWVKFDHTNSPKQEHIMNIRKNFEPVFLVAAVLVAFASFAAAKVPAFHANKPVVLDASKMQVVVIKGHRLSAAEKAALG
jgi:hypothetical protein